MYFSALRSPAFRDGGPTKHPLQLFRLVNWDGPHMWGPINQRRRGFCREQARRFHHGRANPKTFGAILTKASRTSCGGPLLATSGIWDVSVANSTGNFSSNGVRIEAGRLQPPPPTPHVCWNQHSCWRVGKALLPPPRAAKNHSSSISGSWVRGQTLGIPSQHQPTCPSVRRMGQGEVQHMLEVRPWPRAATPGHLLPQLIPMA